MVQKTEANDRAAEKVEGKMEIRTVFVALEWRRGLLREYRAGPRRGGAWRLAAPGRWGWLLFPHPPFGGDVRCIYRRP